MYPDSQHSTLAEEQYLGEPHSGDFDMGAGVSTSQLQNPNVGLRGAGTGSQGLLQSPAVWVVLAAILILVEYAARKGGGRKEGTVRVGLENFFIVGGLAALWFFAFKMAAIVWKVGPAIQFFGFI